MVQKIILIIVFIIVSQIAKPQPFISGGGQFGSLSNSNLSGIESCIGVSINAGFQYIEHLNAGVEYSYNKRLPSIIDQNLTNLGVFFDYYFFNKPIKPITGIKVAFATMRIKDNIPADHALQKQKGVLISPKLGVGFQSTKHISVSLFGSYDFYLLDINYSFLTCSLKINYSF